MIILFYIQVLECTGENTLSEDKNDNIVLYLGIRSTRENTLSEDKNDNIVLYLGIRVYWREYTIRGQE